MTLEVARGGVGPRFDDMYEWPRGQISRLALQPES
jgi:hypothetical protein